jgi:PKD repeat protein
MRVRASGLLVLALLLVAIPGVLIEGAADAAGTATVPRPDHVVIVVEENHSATNIMGNPDAPFINTLAQQNANFTQSYALTHPSQPNYIALFSGGYQGVTDDTCPHTFSGANFGSQLRGAGFGFTGYSEGLPAAGSTACNSGKYARKHSPWANFSNLPGTTNQPLSAFPTDFNDLPEVSYVIPNLDNDMHDGTVAMGDQWLQTHLSDYISWAKTHNSLFVLTFDEDDRGDNNRIPTVMAGQRVVQGSYTKRIDHYSMLRTLQDAYGLAPLGGSASAAPILDVWSPDGGNAGPTADFTASCPDATCSFDATDSDDPDGSIASYAWTFGDGKTGSGLTTSHEYGSGGSKQVTLTVTDDQGASDNVTKTVTPTGAAPFADDTFSRTVANGWGTADVGGPWTATGKAAGFSVSSGTALLKPTIGGTLTPVLGSTSSDDTDLTTTFSSDKAATGGGLYLFATGRRVSVGNEYRARLRLTPTNTLALTINKLVGGTETSINSPLVVPGLTVPPGKKISVRVQVTGTSPTTVRARVWDAALAEPSTWTQTVQDSTAGLQAAGAVGLSTYLSGTSTNTPVLSFSSLSAQHTQAGGPVDSPPSAQFAPTCTNLACGFDGTGSSDPEGAVASYAWTFGDGSADTGPTTSHTYAAPGTYNVTLKVTDGEGATDSVTQPVTVTAAAGQTLVRDTFNRTVANGWGTADTGGAWSVTGTASTLSVGSGSGAMTLGVGKQVATTLGAVSSTGTDLTFQLSASKVTAGTYFTVTGRRTTSGGEYRARVRLVNGSVTLALSRLVGTTETVLGTTTTLPGITYTAGMPLRVRLQVYGASPTTVRAKVWSAAAAEPSAWQKSTTDTTSGLQSAGSISLLTYLSSSATNGPVVARFSDLTATPAP